ncbi:hypothetical protein [Sorangium sp. So ce887]|uniref:hypothetical protein n=1 Tax=Sorangium sp. So ce887 TaxID=3133324 RepID=UPI003F60A152
MSTEAGEDQACKGRMKLVAMITEPSNIARFLTALGEPTDVPRRSPNRGPPYWGFGAQGAAGDPEPRALKSTVLRRKALGDAA